MSAERIIGATPTIIPDDASMLTMPSLCSD
jgi:hypothetical protein